MILYGQGDQTIRWVPMDALAHARSVAVSYSIVDLRESETSPEREVVASTPATASTVSTTITAAAGPDTANPRRLSVASVAGMRVGGRYLLSAASNASEEAFTIAKVNTSGLEVETTRALTRSFAASDTLVGLEVEGTFPAAVADDEDRLTNGGGPFAAIWSYTVDGVTYRELQELWITRYGVTPWVTFDDCAKHLPGLAQYVGEAVDPIEAIRGATDELFERLYATSTVRRDPAYFRSNLSAALFVRKRAIGAMLLGSRGENSIELARDFRDDAEGHIHNITEGVPPSRSVAVDPVNDTAAAGGETHSASRLFVTP